MSAISSFWLSLDLCSRTPSLCLFENGDSGLRLVGEAQAETRGGLEWFLPSLQTLLASHKIQIAQISKWLLPNGPGSFTGLRIGVASVKGFLTALPGEVSLIDSLEARALAYDSTAVMAYRVGKDQYATGVFDRGTWKAEVVETPVLKTIATRTKVLFESANEAAWEKAEVFPLNARHLGLALENSHTQRTYTSADEWMKLQPEYWGDTRFGAK